MCLKYYTEMIVIVASSEEDNIYAWNVAFVSRYGMRINEDKTEVLSVINNNDVNGSRTKLYK